MAQRRWPPLEASEVLVSLRLQGVVVHHAAVLPIVPQRRTVVVFLEGHLCQWERAERLARRMRSVERVEFAGSSSMKAIMYVVSRP